MGRELSCGSSSAEIDSFLLAAAEKWTGLPGIPVHSAEDVARNPELAHKIARTILGLQGPGVSVVRGVFPKGLVTKINQDIIHYYADHPQQKKDHFSSQNKRIWRYPEKVPPEILFPLLTNPVLNAILDEFLGCWHIGSMAVNTIMPGGPAQKLHSDYPPGFCTPEQMKEYFFAGGRADTSYLLETVFPFFSLQAAVAVDRIIPENGATELIPFSHQLQSSDLLVLNDEAISNCFEKHVVSLVDACGATTDGEKRCMLSDGNPALEPGDVLFFNRKVLHRGGANSTDKPRTALLLQAVMPFGAKMECLDAETVWEKLQRWYEAEIQKGSAGTIKKLSDSELRKVKFRLTGHTFPRDLEEAAVEEKNN
eukprot:TRINITY_DN22646_c2_g1_i1.p1 TRINITY_DN22646_c2_g1~~TRINITY_DN22646_c2_g1_i1.p1  ORF type:complete len:367 (+),score=36.58 TRINITY_DN22646_c2_g1_i1:38-1138(+)